MAVNRTLIASATFVAFGLADILLFGLFSHGDATFAFAQYGAKVGVPNLDWGWLWVVMTAFYALALARAVRRYR